MERVSGWLAVKLVSWVADDDAQWLYNGKSINTFFSSVRLIINAVADGLDRIEYAKLCIYSAKHFPAFC